MIKAVIILLLLSLTVGASAQTKTLATPGTVTTLGIPTKTKAGVRYHFDILSPENGLAQSHSINITQDRTGALWFASDDGITKYDGSSFEYLSQQDGLNHSKTWQILEDNKGQIWITTPGGLNMYDGKVHDYSHIDSVPARRLHCSFRDKDNNIWFGGPNRMVLYNGTSFKDITKLVPLGKSTVRAIMQDSKGKMWFCGMGFVASGLGENFKFEKHIPNMENTTFTGLTEDAKGNIWIGTYGSGVYVRGPNFIVGHNSQNGQMSDRVNHITTIQDQVWIGTDDGVFITDNGKSFENLSTSSGLPENKVMWIEEDNLHNVWIGTHGGGTAKFKGKTFAHFAEQQGLVNSSIMPIVEDKHHNLWMGSKGGIVRFDGEYFYTFSEAQGITNNMILGATIDNQNRLWIGSRSGFSIIEGRKITSYTIANGIHSNKVAGFLQDSDGSMWINTYQGLSRFDGEYFYDYYEGFKSTLFRDMHLAKDGTLWAASSRGLELFSKRKHISHPKWKSDNSEIFSVLQDHANRMWAASYTDGLFCYENGVEVHFTEKEGLANNGVVALQLDRDGNIWASTNHGLTKIYTNKDDFPIGRHTEHKGFALRTYGKADGFDGVEGNQNSFFEDHEGILWVGAADRLTRIDPKQEKINLAPPQTWLKNIQLFYENVDWDKLPSESGSFDSLFGPHHLPKNLTLPYDQNNLTFQFVGTSLKNPERVRYMFRLRGLNDKWSPVTAKTEASYSSLPPGEYVFEVKAKNDEDIWNFEPTAYNFTITPPFWLSTWFILLVITVGIALILGAIKFRTQTLLTRQRELELQVTYKTREIKKEKEESDSMRAIVQLKNEEITDSITYASKIQHAMLNTEHVIETNTSDYFVFFEPKDIVSGDFFWSARSEDALYLTAADCTGHGVPGAMLSMLGMAFLNDIFKGNKSVDPNRMMELLGAHLTENLGQDNKEVASTDGMDMALIKVDYAASQIHFAGANNSAYIISPKKEGRTPHHHKRNEETDDKILQVLQANKFPVGFDFGKTHQFDVVTFDYEPGDVVYLFSDGYADQFGGPKAKKFKYKPFKQLLLSIQDQPMAKQKEIIQNTFQEWRGDLTQIDDVCVLGIKL